MPRTLTVVVVVAVALLAGATGANADQIFSDGFESGDFSAWSQVQTAGDGTAVVQSTIVRTGSLAAQLSESSTAGSKAYVRKTFGSAQQDLTASGDFQVLQQGATGGNVPFFRFFDASSVRLVSLYRQNGTSGSIGVGYGGSYFSTSGSLPLSTWATLALHVITNGTSSTVEVSLNGSLIYQSGSASLGTAGVSTLQIGNDTAAQAFTIVADTINVENGVPGTPSPPVNTSPPTISGTPQDGQALTASPGSWSGTQPITYADQWQRCNSSGANCAPISGATSPTYAVTSADVGSTLRVAVTATNSAGSATASSNATAVVQAGADQIFSDGFESGDFSAWSQVQTTGGGTAVVQSAIVRTGSLAARLSESSTAGSRAYVRKTFGSAQQDLTASGDFQGLQQGATGGNVPFFRFYDASSVRLVSLYRQNGTSGSIGLGYGGSYFSTSGSLPLNTWATLALHVITNGATSTVEVSLNGSLIYQTGSASLGTAGVSTLQIGNDTATQAFTIVADTINVENGVPGTPSPPVNTSPPTISGTPQDGQALTASPGSWSGTQPITYADQWQRCNSSGANCAPISGATSPTYAVTSADVGSTLRVAVTATNSAGSATASSNATAVVQAGADQIFSDGFESGDFSAWSQVQTTGGGTAVVQSAIVRTGSLAARLSESSTAGSRAYVRKTFGSAQQDLTASGDFQGLQQGATGGNVPFFRFYDASSVRLVSLYRQNGTSGSIGLGYGGSYFSTSGSLPLNTWATLALHVITNGATSTVEVSLNGSLIYQTGSASLGTAGVSTLQIGNDTAAQAFTIVADTINVENGVPGTPSPPVNTSPPTISGTPQDGQALTASPGSWSGTQPITYADQWQRCNSSGANCAPISGATSTTYAVTSADVGSTLRVAVTATNSAGSATSSSNATAVVQVGADQIFSDGFESGDFSAWSQVQTTGGGTAVVQSAIVRTGSLAARLSESSTAGSRAYVRKTFGSAQQDLTASGDFQGLQQGATGGNVPFFRFYDASSVRLVSLYRQNGTSGSIGLGYGGSYFSTSGSLPLNTWATLALHVITNGASSTVEVSLNGSLIYQTGSASLGTAGVSTLQIGNDTAAQAFTIVADTINVENGVPGTPSPPVNTSPPTISGTPQDGQTLTASPGSWSGTQPITYADQWQRCNSSGANCAPISGATSPTYAVTSADVGSTLRVAVTATNSAGSATASSNATAVVQVGADQIFSDGFESGDFSAWSQVQITGGGTAVVQSAIVRTGSLAARLSESSTAGSRAYVRKTFGSAQQDLTASGDFQVLQQGATGGNVPFFRFLDPSS